MAGEGRRGTRTIRRLSGALGRATERVAGAIARVIDHIVERLFPGKSGAATLSVISNSVLIALKIAAGAITGSIAILTEAAHSAIDLMASVIALVSVRKADEPADEDHPYGHEKVENLASAIEGMLIVVGAGIIIFEATRRLVVGSSIELPGVGIAVIAFSALANTGVSRYIYRRARETDSPALAGDAAHLRTDSLTSLGVLVGLVLVAVTGLSVFDPIAALLVAAAIVISGIQILTRSSRVLVDEAPPAEELDRIEETIEEVAPPEMIGWHKLRARQAGSRRHVDLHVQFEAGTTLERAHELAHELRGAIEIAVPGADVLIHVEPAQSATGRGGKAPGRSGSDKKGAEKATDTEGAEDADEAADPAAEPSDNAAERGSGSKPTEKEKG